MIWSDTFFVFFGDVTENSLQPTDGLVFPNPEEALSPHSRFVLNLKIYIDVIYKKLNLWQGNPCRPLRSGSSWKIKPSNGFCKNVWWISSDDQRWGLGSLEHTCPSKWSSESSIQLHLFGFLGRFIFHGVITRWWILKDFCFAPPLWENWISKSSGP